MHLKIPPTGTQLLPWNCFSFRSASLRIWEKVLPKAYMLPSQITGIICEYSYVGGRHTTAKTTSLTTVTRDGDKYTGEYSCDEGTGKILGCPACASAIEKFIKAIKTKSNINGSVATREHAEAMTIEELQKIMQWSEAQC